MSYLEKMERKWEIAGENYDGDKRRKNDTVLDFARASENYGKAKAIDEVRDFIAMDTSTDLEEFLTVLNQRLNTMEQ